MKRTLLIIACFALLTTALAQGTVHVRSTVRRDGTVVPAHTRTAPNKTKDDNYSTKGNINPETGKKGTKKP